MALIDAKNPYGLHRHTTFYLLHSRPCALDFGIYICLLELASASAWTLAMQGATSYPVPARSKVIRCWRSCLMTRLMLKLYTPIHLGKVVAPRSSLSPITPSIRRCNGENARQNALGMLPVWVSNGRIDQRLEIAAFIRQRIDLEMISHFLD